MTDKKLITSIEDITMDKVIKCTCEGDLSVLVISGEHTPEEKHLGWINLKSQYLEVVNSSESGLQIEMMQEVTEYDWKRSEIESLLSLLVSDGYDADIVQLLKEDYEFPFPLTEATYKADIDKIRAMLGSEAMNIDLMRIQVYGDGENKEETKKITKDTYYNSILLFQKHLGLCAGMTPFLVCKQLTWYEYGMCLNQYNEIKVKPTENVESE